MCGLFHAIWYETYDLWDAVLLRLGGLLMKFGLWTCYSTTTLRMRTVQNLFLPCTGHQTSRRHTCTPLCIHDLSFYRLEHFKWDWNVCHIVARLDLASANVYHWIYCGVCKERIVLATTSTVFFGVDLLESYAGTLRTIHTWTWVDGGFSRKHFCFRQSCLGYGVERDRRPFAICSDHLLDASAIDLENIGASTAIKTEEMYARCSSSQLNCPLTALAIERQ